MAPQSFVLAVLLVAVAVVGQVPLAAKAGESESESATTTTILLFGQVPCSKGTNIVSSAVPPFPNAKVNFVCGNGMVMGTATTDAKGVFFAQLDNVPKKSRMVASLLAGRCRAVVTTPLAECNRVFEETTQKLSASLHATTERVKVVHTSILEDFILGFAAVSSDFFG